jgi:glycosyltransferase involved in cell wall biosynthesis
VKIAYLVADFPKPSETFVSREILALRALGLDVKTFAFQQPAAAEQAKLDPPTQGLIGSVEYLGNAWLLSGALRSWSIPRIWRENADLQRTSMMKSNSHLRLLRAASLATQLQAAGIRHLHAHWPYATIIAHLVHKLTGISYSISVHAHEVEYDYGHFRSVFDSLSFATFCNRAAMERLLGRLPASARERSHLVYHGVDLNRFRPLAFPETGGVLKVISAGRLTRSKGFERLVRACATARSLGAPVELTILGAGNLETVLRKIAADCGFTDAFHLPGWLPHDRVAERLAGAHVFALMADTEYGDGLPNVVLEAMASGRPVILSPLPAAEEAITHGVEGLILNSATEEEGMVNALQRLAGERAKLPVMAQAARRRVESQFDQNIHVRRLKDLFEKFAMEQPAVLAA